MQKLNKGEIKMNSSELKGKKVIIAPFSIDAIFVYHKLIKEGIDVIAFMDKDRSLHTKQYKETVIVPYMWFPEDIIVIIANAITGSKEEIKNNVLSEGYLEENLFFEQDIFFSVSDSEIANEIDIEQLVKIKNRLWVRLIKRKIYEITDSKEIYLRQLNVIVTSRCTLKCKGCQALMDYYYPKQQVDMDLKPTIEYIDLVMSVIDYAENLVPIGGEPFLYKDLEKLLEHIINQKYLNKIGRILLITNGTVIPSDYVLRLIGKHSSLIEVFLTSDYGKYSKKRYELVNLLNKYGCNYKNHTHDTWILTNQPVIPSAKVTENEIIEKCSKCSCNRNEILRIWNNKLYNCNFVTYADKAQLIPHNKEDYLDMYKDKINKETLKDFIHKITPGRAYCGMPIMDTGYNHIPAGEQTKEVKECVRFDR